MNKIMIIARRELNSFFESLMAYILLIALLGFSGFFTWIYFADIFFVNQASLQSFFGIAYWTLFFVIPALTMRSLAEEFRLGTIELLLTKPLNEWHIVAGKFLAILFLVLIALAFTLPYYLTVANLGPIDHGSVIVGYLGLIFMSATYISIGLFASSISNNQIVAFLLSLFIGIFFHWLFAMVGGSLQGIPGAVISYLSVQNHYDAMSRGVIDSKDLVYFISVSLVALYAAFLMLQRKKA